MKATKKEAIEPPFFDVLFKSVNKFPHPARYLNRMARHRLTAIRNNGGSGTLRRENILLRLVRLVVHNYQLCTENKAHPYSYAVGEEASPFMIGKGKLSTKLTDEDCLEIIPNILCSVRYDRKQKRLIL